MLNSPVDIAVVLGVALLIFGPKKLPELGKALGQGIGNFKKSLQDTQDQLRHSFEADSRTDDKTTASGDPRGHDQV